MNIHLQNELSLKSTVSETDANPQDVKRIQEWLCLHGYYTAIDGYAGPSTFYQIELFQRKNGLNSKNPREFNSRTFQFLTGPLHDALNTSIQTPLSFRQCVLTVARQHLEAKAKAVGSKYDGPWVRVYALGEEIAWCSAFVCFVFEQAAAMRRSVLYGETCESPFQYTFSCNALAQQALKFKRDRLDFIPEKNAMYKGSKLKGSPILVRPGDLFFMKNKTIGYKHVGIVLSVEKDTFHTIEGCTRANNDIDSREVTKRVRDYKDKDFVTYDALEVKIK